MKTLLILGGDKITRSALETITTSAELMIAIDNSTSLRRVLRLIVKRRIGLLLVIKMIVCEILRKNPKFSTKEFVSINNNSDVLRVIDEFKPERICLFRAGLVISREVIQRGVPLMNIHCAKVPEYGGLGSIDRAIKDKAVEQHATLHQVTTTIDRGKVFDLEPFYLDLKKSYCINENTAYKAGLRLLKRTISC
jgi:hypothetical protein